MSLRTIEHLDPADITAGRLPAGDVLWRLGREMLGHTNDVWSIINGQLDRFGPELSARYNAGLSLSTATSKGVWIERHVDRKVLWRSKWRPIAELLVPVVADRGGPLVLEVLAAGTARRDYTARERPSYKYNSEDPHWSAEACEARSAEWTAIERRCYAAADACWLEAQPGQRALW